MAFKPNLERAAETRARTTGSKGGARRPSTTAPARTWAAEPDHGGAAMASPFPPSRPGAAVITIIEWQLPKLLERSTRVATKTAGAGARFAFYLSTRHAPSQSG